MPFKALEPHDQGIKHGATQIIWMECLPEADTVGKEDEIGFTCLKLMWMDGVMPDWGRARRWATKASAALPKAVTPVTRSRMDKAGSGFSGPGTAVIRLVPAAAHQLFLVELCLPASVYLRVCNSVAEFNSFGWWCRGQHGHSLLGTLSVV